MSPTAADQPDNETPIDARRRWLVIALCFLAAIVDGFDLQVMSIAGPQVREVMGLSAGQLGWIFSASVIGLGIGSIVGGYLADRIGRRLVLTISIALLGVSTVATAYAWDYWSLMVLRIAGGAAIGGVMPNIVAAVANVSRRGRITGSVALMIAGQPIGGVIVSLAGRGLSEQFGWQSLFLLGGFVPLILAPLMFFTLPESRADRREAGKKGLGGREYLNVLFGQGRAAPTLLLWASFSLTLAVMATLLSWTPSLLMQQGFPRGLSFGALMWINIGGIAGSFALGALCDRIGVRPTMIGAYVLMAIGLFLFSREQSADSILPVAALTGFAVLGVQFALFGVAPRVYAPEHRGAGVGTTMTAGRVGSLLGSVVAGELLHGGISERGLFLVMTPVALAAGLCVVALTIVARDALKKGSGASFVGGH